MNSFFIFENVSVFVLSNPARIEFDFIQYGKNADFPHLLDLYPNMLVVTTKPLYNLAVKRIGFGSLRRL